MCRPARLPAVAHVHCGVRRIKCACMRPPHACPRSHMCTVACSLVCVYAVILSVIQYCPFSSLGHGKFGWESWEIENFQDTHFRDVDFTFCFFGDKYSSLACSRPLWGCPDARSVLRKALIFHNQRQFTHDPQVFVVSGYFWNLCHPLIQGKEGHSRSKRRHDTRHTNEERNDRGCRGDCFGRWGRDAYSMRVCI
jgi:hypothetical protein